MLLNNMIKLLLQQLKYSKSINRNLIYGGTVS